MVMSEVIKDKERLALQEFKEDEYGSKEVVRKKSLDSDDDFNEDEDEDPVLREIWNKRLAEIKSIANEKI